MTYRFNIYYEVGQEVAVDASSEQEARDLIKEGEFRTIGYEWATDANDILIEGPNEDPANTTA